VSGWTVEDYGMHFLHSISYGFIMKFSFKLDIGMDHLTWLNEIFMKSHKACNLPKGLALSIECMQMTCADNCTEDMYSESCTNCKKERCMKEGKPGKGKGGKHAARKTAGGAPRQKPLAILDKVTLIPIIVS